jgi:hypothetical protein
MNNDGRCGGTWTSIRRSCLLHAGFLFDFLLDPEDGGIYLSETLIAFQQTARHCMPEYRNLLYFYTLQKPNKIRRALFWDMLSYIIFGPKLSVSIIVLIALVRACQVAITDRRKYEALADLQWYNVHTGFCENWSNGSNFYVGDIQRDWDTGITQTTQTESCKPAFLLNDGKWSNYLKMYTLINTN